jgi:hypothetical protein
LSLGGARAPLAATADPAAFMARLMDLHGSVALARELAQIERMPATAAEPAAQADGLRLRAFVREQLAELAGAIELTFAEPFQRRNKLPDAAATLDLLEQSGALLARSGRGLGSAAPRLWDPFGELAARLLGRIRQETRALRAEIAPTLRALGPEATRLERLDAALFAATQKGRERVLGELTRGLERAFVRAFRDAVAALPEDAGREHVAAWFGPGQWLRGEMARMRQVLLSVCAHESRRLLSLAEAGASGSPAPAAG